MPAPHGLVSALTTTAVKGLRLDTREQIELGRAGVAENRRLFLIDGDARMVNGKRIGILTAVGARHDHATGRLTLEFPAGEVVDGTVALGETLATRLFSRVLEARVVEGPWSAALSDYAGRALRLVQAADGAGAVDRGSRGTVSLISRASVARLARLAGSEVDARRFRMLVEVEGVPAHAEDGWVGHRMRIGGALVRMGGHVGRCLVTNLSPETGEPDLPTLDLLGYRRGLATTEPLAFGIYGAVLEPGIVRVGDPVHLHGAGPVQGVPG